MSVASHIAKRQLVVRINSVNVNPFRLDRLEFYLLVIQVIGGQ